MFFERWNRYYTVVCSGVHFHKWAIKFGDKNRSNRGTNSSNKVVITIYTLSFNKGVVTRGFLLYCTGVIAKIQHCCRVSGSKVNVK